MTLQNYIIPLINEPQTFEMTLAGIDYNLTVKWNDSDDAGWILDIADASSNPIVAGIPLVTGVDLLAGLEYLAIGGSLFVMTNGSSPFDVPTLDNLGTDSNLYFQTESTDE